MNPFELHGLTKQYPGFRLDHVDLTVPHGYVMGLVGANGSGKTTTIKCALGMVHPDAGDIHVINRQRLGVVLDQVPYAPAWTVKSVANTLRGFYPQWDDTRFTSLIEAAGIAPNKKVKELSRGMGTRLQLAVALSHDADLLILDEPTSGLDPLARDDFVNLIADYMTDDNHSVLFSTHITTDLERIADYVTIMSNGQVLVSGPTEQLQDDYRMVRGGAPLPAEMRPVAHGLRSHPAGWDALIPTEHTIGLNGAAIERPSLDDIVIRLARKDRHVTHS